MPEAAPSLDDLVQAVGAGQDGAIEQILSFAPQFSTDHELIRAVETLVENGRPDWASRVIASCRQRPGFSDGMLATATSRFLAGSGRLSDAIAHLTAEVAKDPPHIAAVRAQYHLMERWLDFDASIRLSGRAALLFGQERDLRYTLDRLTYTFNYGPAQQLLEAFKTRYPGQAPRCECLSAEIDNASCVAQTALQEYGPCDVADEDGIFEVLSKPGVPPQQVLWGKQALISLLNSERMTESAYKRFAWYLPNWEEGRVRDHVLSAARKRLPDNIFVMRGWLQYLITQSFYGDAAAHCNALLALDSQENILFYASTLLRLHRDGAVPPFMDPFPFEELKAKFLERAVLACPGFQSVMRDHIIALGGPVLSWPDDSVSLPFAPEAIGLRRLFAVTTGRLSLSAHVRPLERTAPIRPVLAISGQLRGFETTWSSIHRHLCLPTNAPVIVSVWDKTVNATGRHARRLERALPDDLVAKLRPEERYTDAFAQNYPETYNLLFGQTDVDGAAVRDVVTASPCRALAIETESERFIEDILPRHVSANMLKMYYKFSRLETLIREAETASGELYSHVIWTRPDCHILRLSPGDINACLARPDLVWSSFTTETSFGDYVMILPRRAFAIMAQIFQRVVTGGDTVLMPWRPDRSTGPGQTSHLAAFGGPDVFFDVLLAAGYNPVGRIPRMQLLLAGRTPSVDLVRQTFKTEHQQQRLPAP